jgi:hypothetical protein
MQANRMPGDFVTNQIGHTSPRVTSGYTILSTTRNERWQNNADLYSKRAVVLVAELVQGIVK